MKKWVWLGLILLSAVAVGYYLLPEDALPPNTKIDKLVIIKSRKIMMAYERGKLIKTYRISIGQNSVGDKTSEGDKRTPEGTYTINSKNPNSGYHKNLGVSYPNPEDVKAAIQKGVRPGGDIKIHGLRNGLGFIGKFHRFSNWTAGCIAVTNTEVDELYNVVDRGTPIVIEP